MTIFSSIVLSETQSTTNWSPGTRSSSAVYTSFAAKIFTPIDGNRFDDELSESRTLSAAHCEPIPNSIYPWLTGHSPFILRDAAATEYSQSPPVPDAVSRNARSANPEDQHFERFIAVPSGGETSAAVDSRSHLQMRYGSHRGLPAATAAFPRTATRIARRKNRQIAVRRPVHDQGRMSAMQKLPYVCTRSRTCNSVASG